MAPKPVSGQPATPPNRFAPVGISTGITERFLRNYPVAMARELLSDSVVSLSHKRAKTRLSQGFAARKPAARLDTCRIVSGSGPGYQTAPSSRRSQVN